MQLSGRTRVKRLAAVGVAAIALLLLGVFVLVQRRDDSDSGSQTTEPIQHAPETTPDDVPVTTPPVTGSTITLPQTVPGVPSLGPASFPSSACSTPTANDRYVAPDGNDTNPGTLAAPYRTINHAQQQIVHGQALFIRGGRYYNLSPTGEQDNFIEVDGRGKGSATQWLKFCAYPGERPVLIANQTEAGAILIRGTDRVHIEGLELIGSAIGRTAMPPKGAIAAGIYVGSFGTASSESNHTRIWNNLIHGFGASGIQLNLSNNTDIRGNYIWDNAHWSEFATSGISLFWPSAGAGNDQHGFGNYIVGNMLWDNYMSDKLYSPKSPFGLTDGNCIIVDENGHYTDQSKTRTLIRNNICVANGGPGVALSRSGNVEVSHNTFYMNNLTKLTTVVNHGEFLCQGMQGRDTIEGRSVFTKCDRVAYKNNVVVARPDRPNVYTANFDTDVEFAGNVWVKTGFDAKSSSDTVLPNGTPVIRNPNTTEPRTGDWTTINEAAGKGAFWPLDPR
jgi:parallel beta-helix repeat protein